jgi:hypothetical protein
MVIARGLARLYPLRWAYLFTLLFVTLINTHQWTVGVGGLVVQVKQLFHVGYEACVCIWG